MRQAGNKSNRGARPVLPPISARLEQEAGQQGAMNVAGVDEAGRGPLAGPVVAAAVILAPDFPELGINDSKLLSGAGREAVFHRIEQTAVAVGIGIVEPDVIDRINILQATRAAMVKAVHAITPPPDYLLIDGPIALDLTLAQQSVIHGDRISFSIAAAGIMAKVTRDRIMEDLDRRYPGYGFASHKGYPTSAHKEAIVRLGPCPVHRRCFRGVKEHCPIG